MQLFLILALAGFVASTLVNVLGWLGIPSPFGSATMGLHVGMFVVLLPAMWKAFGLRRHGARQARGEAWRILFANCPPWVRTAIGALFVYTFFNFFTFIAAQSDYPKGKAPVLLTHRGFSGHWMLFYAVAAAALWSQIRGKHAPGLCPNGHPILPTASYCGTCGASLS